MSVGFFETHREFFRPTSVRDTLYSPPPRTSPTRSRPASDVASFKASARSLDQGIGAVLNALHELGLVDEHPGRLHDRPRPRLPAREGDPVRSRHRRDDDHARPGRVHRREGGRLDGQPPRRLPDALRARGRRAPATGSEGISLLPLVRGEVSRVHEASSPR